MKGKKNKKKFILKTIIILTKKLRKFYVSH